MSSTNACHQCCDLQHITAWTQITDFLQKISTEKVFSKAFALLMIIEFNSNFIKVRLTDYKSAML